MEEKERTYRLQRETPTPIPPQAISLHPITTTPQSYYTIPLQKKIGQNKQKIQSSSSRNFGDSKLPNFQVPVASNQRAIHTTKEQNQLSKVGPPKQNIFPIFKSYLCFHCSCPRPFSNLIIIKTK